MTGNLRFLFILAFLCGSLSLSAQESADMGTATLDANYCLTLNTDQPLNEFYSADISGLGFDTELDAKKTFGMKSNNLITYSVDYSNNRVIAHLHLDRTREPKDLQWWSDYLKTVCGQY